MSSQPASSPIAASPLAHTAPLALHPIDVERLAPGGAPGELRRLMLFAALQALSGPRIWRHGGRGPDAWDWLGFVRACAAVVFEACLDADGPPPDLAGYAPSWTEGPSPDAAAELLAQWGLVRRELAAVRPGDVVLFAMPAAHAGVVTAVDAECGVRLAHAWWGRALCETWLDDWWRARAVAAYGWT
jgi:hypothetical protein